MAAPTTNFLFARGQKAKAAGTSGEGTPVAVGASGLSIAPAGMESMQNINEEALKRPVDTPNPERATSALLSIPTPENRDAWGVLLWAAKAAGVPRDVALSWSADKDGDSVRLDHAFNGYWDTYDPDRPGGTKADTLYFKAREVGWVVPARRAPSQPTSAGAGAGDTGGDGDAVSAGDAQITDIWLASWYVADFKGAFRYDHSCKQYRAYRDGSWVVCMRGEYIEAAKKFGAMLLEKAIVKLRADSQSGASKRLMACAMRAQSAGGIDAALRLAQSDPAIAVSAEDFDKDPAMFNCANGVIDLRTGVLLPHSPALMVSRQSPVAYDPDARCPMFDKFMHEISCGDPDWEHYFQRVMGYSLSGYVTEEKLFVWIGPGANGKSVVGNMQQHIMGGYGGVAPASFLMRQREGNSNGATPEIANLMGKRMVSANEVESGSKLSVQTVKNVVSTETITARHLYGGPFTFTPTHKLNLRVNHRPGITDTDEGCWRRVDIIPFDMNLSPAQRDQGLEARLMTEVPGILAWMVRGFQNWQREGLIPARRVLEASLAYRNESDLLGQWVSEACTLGGSFAADQMMAYRQYGIWAESQGLRAYTKVSFTRALSEQGFRAGRQGSGVRGTTYIGFRLNTA